MFCFSTICSCFPCWLVLLALVTNILVAEESREADSINRDYRSELPRIHPMSPAEALSSFTVAPGFQLELVAAEPLVVDPIAMAFDERGRLFIVEMRGYSENADEHLGRIRLLVDQDGDGRFDTSQVYAEGLSWPTAIACYDGGILLGMPPDILYLQDTDGDGKADQRQVLYTGFGRGNVQGLINSFQWGLDNRIHGSSSTMGGEVLRVNGGDVAVFSESTQAVTSEPLSMRGRNFALEPRTMSMQPTTGGGQHGMSFNQWGHKFVCSNSDHIQYVRFEDYYLARNPYFAAPNLRHSIAEDGPQANVFRTSPVEPWRIVRTRLRAKGIVPGIVEKGGKAAGYFTSSTGITIYRGNAWPKEYVGWAIVGDVGGNLIHRKQVTATPASYTAKRVDDQSEFVSSSDIWFRPVQFANGPDGTLYVVDMYREVIEHPKSLPAIIKRHLDLTSGRDQGRIYRIIPTGFQQPPPPQLHLASTAKLVNTLQHPNGWHRDTAARLLYQQRDQTAISLLRKMLYSQVTPVGCIHTLYALHGFSALSTKDILRGLTDEHPRVREHAVRLSEQIAKQSSPIREHLYAMVDDDDLRVRIQLAATLGEVSTPQRLVALAQLIRRDGDLELMQTAVMSALAQGAGKVLGILAGDTTYRSSKSAQQWLAILATQIGKQKRPDDVAAVLAALARLSTKENQIVQVIVEGLAAEKDSELEQQLAAVTGGRAKQLIQELLQKSVEIAGNVEADTAQRNAAIGRLQLGKFDDYQDLLTELLQPSQPAEVQVATMEVLATFRSPLVAHLLIGKWAELTPQVRSRAADVLFSRNVWLMPLLEAIAQGHILPLDLGSTRLQLLTQHQDKTIQKMAKQLVATSSPDDRREVIAAYGKVLSMRGDKLHGKQVFAKVCAACHQVEKVGHSLGPNLATLQNRGRESILTNVLDPNREVNPQYLNYVVYTEDGRSLTGMISEETATSVTLQRANNTADTILRVEIEQLRSTGKSFMPEGVEKQVDPQAMSDLIEYLMSLD